MPKNTKESSRMTRTSTRSLRVSKEQAAGYLGKVPEDKAFWCHDGAVLRDMRELKEALAAMSDQTYAYHSNAIKNDFSHWVRDIIGDDKLANDMESAASREEAVKIVEKRYSLLSKAAG